MRIAGDAVYLEPFDPDDVPGIKKRHAALASLPNVESAGDLVRALRTYFGSLDTEAQLRCGLCEEIAIAGLELSEDVACASCMDGNGFPVEMPECLRCGGHPFSASDLLAWAFYSDWTGQGHSEWLCPGCEEEMWG